MRVHVPLLAAGWDSSDSAGETGAGRQMLEDGMRIYWEGGWGRGAGKG